MNLKYKGNAILVTLTKPEQSIIARAMKVLAGIALVPCAEQEHAKAAMESLKALEGLSSTQDETAKE